MGEKLPCPIPEQTQKSQPLTCRFKALCLPLTPPPALLLRAPAFSWAELCCLASPAACLPAFADQTEPGVSSFNRR